MPRNVMASGLLLVALLGCNGGTSPSSADIDLTGTWVGTVQENIGGSGTFRATLSQSGSVVSGSWVIAFPARRIENAGRLEGTVIASSLTATLTPLDRRTCLSNLSAISDGDQMRGTYLAVNCAGIAAGSFSTVRR